MSIAKSTCASETETNRVARSIALRDGDAWVSCSREVNEQIASERHIVRIGGLTTVCGASASHREVWRRVPANSRKDFCRACVRAYPSGFVWLGTGRVAHSVDAIASAATPFSSWTHCGRSLTTEVVTQAPHGAMPCSQCQAARRPGGS